MEGEGKRRGREGRKEVRERETVNESVNVNMNMEESQAARELLDRSERKQGMCCGSLSSVFCVPK